MTARVSTEETLTITLTLTRRDAERIYRDFDHQKEPSGPSKALIGALVEYVRQPAREAALREAFAAHKPAEDAK